jgi:flagellum-specific peptidoglycan hydrolase FlgJ
MRQKLVRWLIVASVAVCGVVAVPAAAQAAEQEEFIAEAGQSAQPSQQEYQVPASVTVAQAILESGWGDSELAREAKNYFGMKCHDDDPGPIAVDCMKAATKECRNDKCYETKDYFRVYDSMADSYRDHGAHLSDDPRYAKAFDHSDDADAFIAEVHKAGYATDPGYTDKIVKLMRTHDLYRFNETPAT